MVFFFHDLHRDQLLLCLYLQVNRNTLGLMNWWIFFMAVEMFQWLVSIQQSFNFCRNSFKQNSSDPRVTLIQILFNVQNFGSTHDFLLLARLLPFHFTTFYASHPQHICACVSPRSSRLRASTVWESPSTSTWCEGASSALGSSANPSPMPGSCVALSPLVLRMN